MSSYTENIALFPLKLFLLPGQTAHLYIFEERYKQLIDDCIAKQIEHFGIAYSSPLNTDNLGSLVKLEKVIKEHPGGEKDILIKAEGIFKLEKFKFQKEGKLYPGGEIVVLDDLSHSKASTELINTFNKYQVQHDHLNELANSEGEVMLFDIAGKLLTGDFEKLELVSQVTDEAMDTYLINYIGYLKLLELQEQSVQGGIYLN